MLFEKKYYLRIILKILFEKHISLKTISKPWFLNAKWHVSIKHFGYVALLGESPPQARIFCGYFCFFQGFVRQNWAPQAKILRSISGIHKDQPLFENHYYLRILFANTTIWEYYLRIAIFANSHHVKTSLFEKILFENVFWHQIIENGTLFENFEFSNSFRYYLRIWLFDNFEFIIWE